jgi:hypothetical protein
MFAAPLTLLISGSERYDNNLVCYTPPFVIRAKVTTTAAQGAKEKLIPMATAPQNAPH